MKKISKREIMKRAWEIAREGVKKFGGKLRIYLSDALKEAWECAKSNGKMYVAYVTDKETKVTSFVYHIYCNKSLFRKDLICNGYTVHIISTPNKLHDDMVKYEYRKDRQRRISQLKRESEKSIKGR